MLTAITKAGLLATTPTATTERYRVTDATPPQREAYPDGSIWRYTDNNSAVDETLLSYTPTGTTETVTLANGPIQTLDLGSATGTVAVTLTRPGRSNGHLIIKQGATPRAITVSLSAGTLVTLGTAVVLSSDAANTRRIFSWSCDGTDLILAPSEVSV